MVPEALKSRTQWLVWRYESKEGQKKPAKMPYYASGRRRTGKQGDEADRQALTTFDFALQTKSIGTTDADEKFDGIGFAFLPGDGLIGIDLDNMLDVGTGEFNQRALDIIQACSSFAERSPSGKGVHIYVLGETASFNSNDAGVEVFCGRQFFTVTGDHFPGTPDQVNAIDEKTLKRLRATVDQAKGKRGASTSRPAPPADARSKIESALAVISADCGYEEWIEIGMAIHAELGDAGFSVWDYWSSKGSSYPGPRGANGTETHWKSFRPGGGITGATLFKRAKDAGWRAPKGSRAPTSSKGAGGDRGGTPPPEDPASAPPADELPEIRWQQGKLPEVIDQAEDALIKAGERIYQRAGFLVRVVRRDSPTVRNYKRPPGAFGILMIDQPHLIEILTRVARWMKWDSRSEAWRRVNAPEQAASTLLARSGHWKVDKLWSAISAPTLRPDGTILQKPGYDASMRAWYDPCGVEFPEIADSPTKEDAQTALAKLAKAFSTFPFEDERDQVVGRDQAVALAFALTALVRRSLPHAPLGAISAPAPGSGKTLLADCISILASGAAAPAMKYAETDEEAAKTALAVLMEGDAVVLIDNIERPLQGDWLCTILTSELFRQRMLGRTEMMSVPTTTLWLATGNQLVIAGDLRTRALLCRLDAKVEHPDQREFAHDLREWMTAHRPELVAAGLTVMRAFIASGQRPADVIKPMGRFERWSDMVRAPLVWLGCADPCESIKSLEQEDPERALHVQLMHAWREQFEDRPQTAREAIDDATRQGLVGGGPSVLEGALREIAQDRSGSINVRRLGKWMQSHAGRRADGMLIVKDGEKDHVARWRVKKSD
jgi:hypothetical protein